MCFSVHHADKFSMQSRGDNRRTQTRSCHCCARQRSPGRSSIRPRDNGSSVYAASRNHGGPNGSPDDSTFGEPAEKSPKLQ